MPLPDGDVLLIRPNRRRKSWLVWRNDGRLVGGYKTLDAALTAAHAYARDVQIVCASTRQIAHT